MPENDTLGIGTLGMVQVMGVIDRYFSRSIRLEML